MKEYLENRLKELQERYSESLTKSAKSGLEMSDKQRKEYWTENVSIQIRIDEIKSALNKLKSI